jgi:OmpA-OmpF porin, OOP family
MRFFPLFYLVWFSHLSFAAMLTDGDWNSQLVELKDTTEAEYSIRVGDIDNLGFGFPENFSPFTGRATDPHPYPFEPNERDVAPFDRILVSSAFTGEDIPEGQDGYSAEFHATDKPLTNSAISIPLGSLKDVKVCDCVLCLSVDDFQPISWKAYYEVTFNGIRFPEMERVINSLTQTGPIGKVIYVSLTGEMLDQLKSNELKIFIDDPKSKAGDGFAFDFAKLLVNVKEFLHVGSIPGRIVDEETGEPIANATVSLPGLVSTTSSSDGSFTMKKVPAGLAVVSAEAAGYETKRFCSDVVSGEISEAIEIPLTRSASINFNGKSIRQGERITLETIQFDGNSDRLRPESSTELDKLVTFLNENPTTEIEISGHTSNEGEAKMNREVSCKRVRSCKRYLTKKGVSPERITTSGHGPDLPVAANDTERNRALNCRVELKLTNL